MTEPGPTILSEPSAPIPPEPETRGPGRPTKEEAQRKADEEAARMMAEGMLQSLPALLAWPFDVAASRRGEHWRLTPAEKRQLGDAARPMAEKYALGWLMRFGPEILFVGTLGMILGPRVSKDRAIAKAKKEGKAPPKDEPAAPPKNPEQARKRPGRPKKGKR